MSNALEDAFRAKRAAGEKLFAPYVTAGLPGVDAELLRSLEAAGADGIELGVPFSDPIMDGGVVQQASEQALAAGFHTRDAFALAKEAALGIPILLMTYYNPIMAMGEDAWIAASLDAGISGFIVPDLPVDEGADLAASCRAAGIAMVFLAAPGTSESRLKLIAERADGFIYCVATYGVTGARDDLGGTAQELVEALRPLTDLPLLVGVGITTPDQAQQAASFADGAIVGSAIVRRLIEHDRDGAIDLARSFGAVL